MPRPIPETVPQDIAEIIRSNPKWGDLKGFAESEGMTTSTVYSFFFYSKHRHLMILHRLGRVTKTNADVVYEVLTIPNVVNRKAAFKALYKNADIKSLGEVSEVAEISSATLRRYLTGSPPDSLVTCKAIGSKLGLGLRGLAESYSD